jgi:hypothetical protein
MTAKLYRYIQAVWNRRGPQMTEEQNGEDKMVYGFEDQKLIIRKLPKIGAVFSHLQGPTRMPARSAGQSDFSVIFQIFVHVNWR